MSVLILMSPQRPGGLEQRSAHGTLFLFRAKHVDGIVGGQGRSVPKLLSALDAPVPRLQLVSGLAVDDQAPAVVKGQWAALKAAQVQGHGFYHTKARIGHYAVEIDPFQERKKDTSFTTSPIAPTEWPGFPPPLESWAISGASRLPSHHQEGRDRGLRARIGA